MRTPGVILIVAVVGLIALATLRSTRRAAPPRPAPSPGGEVGPPQPGDNRVPPFARPLPSVSGVPGRAPPF